MVGSSSRRSASLEAFVPSRRARDRQTPKPCNSIPQRDGATPTESVAFLHFTLSQDRSRYMKPTCHKTSSIAVCFFLFLLTATIYAGQTKKTGEKAEQQRSAVQNSETWMNVFPIGQQIFCLERDAQAPDIIYACSHRGLYKTNNGGMTWLPVISIDVNALLFVQSKSSPNVMYLGYSVGQAGRILKSADGGKSWEQIAGEDIKRTIRSLGVDPKNADGVYVLADSAPGPFICTGCVLYKSRNGGKTWGNITPELKVGEYPLGAPIRFVWFDPVNQGHMFVG